MDKMTNSNACTKQIGQVLRTADSLLHDSILGIYLHGSATLNRLRPDSDIDILIITAKDLSDWEREHLTRQLLDISGPVGCPGKRPLEIAIIALNDIRPWRFPPRCDYMYGEWLREEMEAGHSPQACHDPDVTILLWQARQSSRTLQGAESRELIPDIPFHDIKKAMHSSLPGLVVSLKGDERNVLLTLSRMWFTLETMEIATKDVAAEWVLPKLPEEFVHHMKRARQAYLGNLADDWETRDKEARALALFMQEHIERLLKK